MKINKFFMGLGTIAALSLAACSNDEPANIGDNTGEAAFGDQYLSVSIMMPTANGSRKEGEADNDKDKYTDGTKEESQVTNIVFFFFDENNNIVDIQMENNPTFTAGSPFESENPYVTSFGGKEVRLKAGFSYKQVAVVLNTKAKDATTLIGEIKNLDQFLDRAQNYAAQVNGDGTNQVMSNSVFYNTADRDAVPSASDKYILVPITENNIYSSAQKGNPHLFVPTIQGGFGKEVVDIFVERVASKVTVASNLNMNNYYTSEEGVNTITLYDHVNLTTKTVKIRPVVKGITLNVLTQEATLIKNLTHNQLGYNETTANGFLWNDPLNKRSYWAMSPSYGKEKMTYYSFDQVEEYGLTSLSSYINPNTQEYEVGKENQTKNTKVMAVAQLYAYDVDDENYAKPITIDLVRYGSEYMESSNLLEHTANLVNMAVRSINWDMLGKVYTAAELEVLKVAVNNSFVDGFTGAKFEIVASGEETDRFDTYSAVIKTVEGFDYDLTLDTSLFDDYTHPDEDVDAAMKAILANNETLEALLAKAKDMTVSPAIESALEDVNKPNILYWKDGKTYFYTTIRHQGFYGLPGGEKYLNGVVRNHIYNVSLDGIYGLGTPVINPGKPIDPERPEMERPSYLQARINILPWRIVTNSATIH